VLGVVQLSSQNDFRTLSSGLFLVIVDAIIVK
jgi:hypothetical protein